MRLRTAAAAFVLMTTLVGCGSDGERAATPAQDTTTTTATAAPTTDGTTTETETTETSVTSYTGAVANTYDVAVEVCKSFGVERVAKDLGTARNAVDAAKAYSLGSVERDGHCQAAFEGCLAGFEERT